VPQGVQARPGRKARRDRHRSPQVAEPLPGDREPVEGGHEPANGRVCGQVRRLDTPGHRHRGHHDLSGLPLVGCAMLPAVVIDGPATGAVPACAFDGLDLAGTTVLLRTGCDAHFGTDRYGDPRHPNLATDAAQRLVDVGAMLVGIDSVNIDETRGGERPVHTLLLDADVPIVEHLTGLDQLPDTGATFTATPVKIAGMSTFPCASSRSRRTDETTHLGVGRRGHAPLLDDRARGRPSRTRRLGDPAHPGSETSEHLGPPFLAVPRVAGGR
jgi:kynurenine formamidase